MDFDKESQQRILRVAADREQGKTHEELDERIAMVMDMHPEYDEVWKMGEMAIYPQEIDGKVVNPFVHTVFHVIVDNQIESESPEFVAEAFNRLLEEETDPHEALHSLIAIYADIHYANFRQGDQFSFSDYEYRLSQLSGDNSSEEDEDED